MGTDSKFNCGFNEDTKEDDMSVVTVVTKKRSNKLLRVMVQQAAQLEWEIIQQDMFEICWNMHHTLI